MQSLHSFANHVCGLTTQTVEAGTHRFHSGGFGATHRHTSAKPSKFLIGYPALLSARRGYPNSAFAANVNDRKTPFGFKIQNIGIRNQFGSKRINNFNHIIAQNKFWSQPEDVDKNTKNCAQHEISNDLNIVTNNPQGVCGKEGNQKIRSARPSEITAGSKGFIHHPSIAGDRK